MTIKLVLYIIFTLLTAFSLSGVNFDNFMKNNKAYEAWTLMFILSCCGGYLLTNFILDFINFNSIF